MVKVFNLPGGEVKVTLGSKRESEKLLNGRHFAYTCRIEYKGEKITFPFHDSIANYRRNVGVTETLILQALECVILDSDSYDNNRDLRSFIDEFGYDDLGVGMRAYLACEEEYQKLHRLFNDDEIRELYELAEQRMQEML